MSLSKKAMSLRGLEFLDDSNFYSEEDVKKAVKKLKREIDIDPKKSNYLSGRFGNSHVELKLTQHILGKLDEIFGEDLE